MKSLYCFFILILVIFKFHNVGAQTFPPFTVTAYDSSSTGYYFMVPIRVGPNPNMITPTHIIIDSTGNVVYYKNFPFGSNTGDFKLHNNGLMSYSFQGDFYIMDSTFAVIDSVNCQNGIITDVHDMQMLPNGNFLLLGYENIMMDLSGYSLFGSNNVPGSSTANVMCGVIQELDQMKNVVFEWHAKDHFLFLDVDESFLTNPNNVDWTHFNAVEQDLDGNILLSSRHFGEITKINRSTGNIMWRLGGNANMFTFVNDTMRFKRQHDVRRLSNGNLTLFDNGDGNLSSTFHFSSGKEYSINEVGLTATLVWSYTDDSSTYCLSMGNFQRKPGGNSLLDYGQALVGNKVFNVVNQSGQKVMEIAFDDTLRSYRSFNYPALPWSLNRPQITCYEISGVYYLDAGPGFSSYKWSTNENTQIIQVSDTGVYSVFVSRGQGGFIRSENFVVNDIADPCGLLGTQELHHDNIRISPNPVNDFLNISFDQFAVSQPFKIYNASGQCVFSGITSEKEPLKLSVESWPAGIYCLRIGTQATKIVKY